MHLLSSAPDRFQPPPATGETHPDSDAEPSTSATIIRVHTEKSITTLCRNFIYSLGSTRGDGTLRNIEVGFTEALLARFQL